MLRLNDMNRGRIAASLSIPFVVTTRSEDPLHCLASNLVSIQNVRIECYKGISPIRFLALNVNRNTFAHARLGSRLGGGVNGMMLDHLTLIDRPMTGGCYCNHRTGATRCVAIVRKLS